MFTIEQEKTMTPQQQAQAAMENNKLTYKVTPEIINGETVKLLEEINGKFFNTVITLRDKAVREALISLGWTPPEAAKRHAAQQQVDVEKLKQEMLERLSGKEGKLDAYTAELYRMYDGGITDTIDHLVKIGVIGEGK